MGAPRPAWLARLALNPDTLQSACGVRLVAGEVVEIETAGVWVHLADGHWLVVDRIVMAPGIDSTPCPPGPAKRADPVTDRMKADKPHGKLIVLDANRDVVTERTNFSQVCIHLLANMIAYRTGVEAALVHSNPMNTWFNTMMADSFACRAAAPGRPCTCTARLIDTVCHTV